MTVRPAFAFATPVVIFALALAGCTATSTSASPTSDPTASHGAPAPSASASATPRLTGLDAPAKKEIAMELVSSAENSSLDWRAQYAYIEDIKDGRG